MYQLSTDKRLMILRLLCEGNSIRGTARLVNVSPVTVLKLLKDVGQYCMELEREIYTSLPTPRIQCDELWSFVKDKTYSFFPLRPNRGRHWIWIAMDVETRFLILWHIGGRRNEDARDFFHKLTQRIVDVEEIYTDGLPAYDTYYLFFPDSTRIIGSTEYVERHNLNMRTNIKRLTRKTNGFSKSMAHHQWMLSLYTMWYNFCRPHHTLGKTPAMAMGIEDIQVPLHYLLP